MLEDNYEIVMTGVYYDTWTHYTCSGPLFVPYEATRVSPEEQAQLEGE